ncbi:MAG: FtsQ-type POTRA domain-containing protein [Clostridia bacterium]|nr:FtsQ-type POTRA domain-containing protein [Clostridia bacterium]
MNHQTTVRTQNESMLSPKRPPHLGKKQPNQKLMRALRASMLIAGGMIVVLGLLLLVLPMFKVQNVEVVGNDYYTVEQIIEASGIQSGDELLALDLNECMSKVFAGCPYVDSCDIVATPFGVKITVWEAEGVMRTEAAGKQISFTKDFKVLEIAEIGETHLSPFLYVKLPPIQSAAVGARLSFGQTTEMSYVSTLLDALEKAEWKDDVTYVDFSERFSLSFVLREQYRIEVGSAQSLDTKLLLAKAKLEKEDGGEDTYAVVDVSEEKGTYREIDKSQLYS